MYLASVVGCTWCYRTNPGQMFLAASGPLPCRYASRYRQTHFEIKRELRPDGATWRGASSLCGRRHGAPPRPRAFQIEIGARTLKSPRRSSWEVPTVRQEQNELCNLRFSNELVSRERRG